MPRRINAAHRTAPIRSGCAEFEVLGVDCPGTVDSIAALVDRVCSGRAGIPVDSVKGVSSVAGAVVAVDGFVDAVVGFVGAVPDCVGLVVVCVGLVAGLVAEGFIT